MLVGLRKLLGEDTCASAANSAGVGATRDPSLDRDKWGALGGVRGQTSRSDASSKTGPGPSIERPRPTGSRKRGKRQRCGFGCQMTIVVGTWSLTSRTNVGGPCRRGEQTARRMGRTAGSKGAAQRAAGTEPEGCPPPAPGGARSPAAGGRATERPGRRRPLSPRTSGRSGCGGDMRT